MSRFVSFHLVEVLRCRDKSRRLAGATRRIEFNEDDTSARDLDEITDDVFLGKLGEMAFSRMAQEDFGIKLVTNFKVYNSTKIGDDGDFFFNGLTIDVKSVKGRGRYLLVQPSMIRPYAVFVLCRLTDAWQTAELVGWAGYRELSVATLLPKGSKIPGTGVVLQASNRAIIDADLNHDFKKLFY